MKTDCLKRVVTLLILVSMVGCRTPLDNKLPATTIIVPSLPPVASEQGGPVGQLAFVSDRRERGNLDIWLFDLATKQMEPLTSDDQQDIGPAWSPDGQTVAFVSFKAGGLPSLRSVTLPDRTIRTLVSSEPGASVWNFVWSRDGQSIFYTTPNGQTGESRVWRFDMQTGRHQQITYGYSPLGVSADNQYLAFSYRLPDPPSSRFPLALRVVRLSDKRDLEPTGGFGMPEDVAWGPKGSLLAVVSGPGFSVYAIEGDQIRKQSVGSSPTEDPRVRLCDLAWSPDGQKILVVLAPLAANLCHGTIWLYDAELTHLEGILPFNGLLNYPRWSKDGQWIIYGRNDMLNEVQLQGGEQDLLEGEIWIAESSGLAARPLIKDCGYNGQPAWRP